MTRFHVTVPATSANLGPGFDCLGLALALHNEVSVECEPVTGATAEASAWSPEMEIQGEGADGLPRDASHLLVRAMIQGLASLATPPILRPTRIAQVNRIPLARGMGSSASTIVAGLAMARRLAGLSPDPEWMLEEATRIEGHPDNVAPAIHGGLTVAFMSAPPREAAPSGADPVGRARCLPLPVAGLGAALAVPDFEVSTHEARSCLPARLPLDDAVFTIAHAALLAGALVTGRHDLLREATRDRVHTPYRAPLVRAWPEVEAAALEAGALAVFISGSGPTVGAFVADADPAAGERVARRMAAAFEQRGCPARPLSCPIDRRGVRVEPA